MSDSKNKQAGVLSVGEERFRAIFATEPECVKLLNKQGELLEMNPAGLAIVEADSPDQIVGKVIVELVALEYKKAFNDLTSRVFKGESGVLEFEIVGLKGTHRWLETHATPLRDATGEIEALLAITRDITKRKQTEGALRDSEERYRDLVENIKDLICTHDLDGKVLSANRALEETLGYELEDFAEENFSRILAPEARDQFEDYLETIRRDGVASGLMLVQTRTGERRIWEYHNTLRTEGVAEPIVRSLARDITEQKHAERELRLIFEITRGLITTPNLDELLKLIHASLAKVLYAENCFVGFHDQATDLMHFEYWVDTFDPVPQPHPPGKGFANYVLRTNQPLLLTEDLRDRMYRSGEVEQSGRPSASWLGVPLRTPSRAIGVLVVQHYEDEDAYNQRDLELLVSVGDHIAPPRVADARTAIVAHLDDHYTFYGEAAGVRIARKHLGWYTKDLDGGAAFRREMNAVATSAEQLAAVCRFFDVLAGQSERLDYFVRDAQVVAMQSACDRSRPASLRGGEALAA